MPHNLAIGVSKYDFFHASPKELLAYLEGWRLKRKMQDERDWMMGMYVRDAVGVVLQNAFAKKGQKKATYHDKPFMQQAEEIKKNTTGEGLTEQEKQRATDFLFASLSIMQSNFELSKAKTAE